MTLQILGGILFPLFGTVVGSAAVFFMKGGPKERLFSLLSGFAAGVMLAASVWSLIIPAVEASSHLGGLAFIPAASGIVTGVLALLLADIFIPLEKLTSRKTWGGRGTALLIFAVTLHNLPEGIAVGAAFAAALSSGDKQAALGATALAIGIGLQNLPEGAIISMPLYSLGHRKSKAFFIGALSGIVEPVGALLALLASCFVSALPFLLCFAAGTMLWVSVTELIPKASDRVGALFFSFGFLLMMTLDIALG